MISKQPAIFLVCFILQKSCPVYKSLGSVCICSVSFYCPVLRCFLPFSSMTTGLSWHRMAFCLFYRGIYCNLTIARIWQDWGEFRSCKEFIWPFTSLRNTMEAVPANCLRDVQSLALFRSVIGIDEGQFVSLHFFSWNSVGEGVSNSS